MHFLWTGSCLVNLAQIVDVDIDTATNVLEVRFVGDDTLTYYYKGKHPLFFEWFEAQKPTPQASDELS